MVETVRCDDTGAVVPVPARVSRVVSLVPSLTEAVAATAPGLLVGATDWCARPAGLEVARVRGTKNPDVEQIIASRPDVVLANIEENRAADVDALREAGVPVWVTVICTVDQALTSLGRMLTEACRLPAPSWLDEARQVWAAVPEPDRDVVRPQDRTTGAGRRRIAVVPIWRRPWMVLGRDTFAGDVLARLGIDNAFGHHPERYPKVPIEELVGAAPDLVVLPDEPYRFTADDGPECFPGLDVALVDGRDLTWYGPSLVDAPARLAARLGVGAV